MAPFSIISSRIIIALAGLVGATSLATGSAHAQTVSGTFDPFNGYFFVGGPSVPGPGTYRYDFQFSRPATGGTAWIGQNYIYDIYDSNGTYLYGNDIYSETRYDFVGPVAKGSVIFTLPANYTRNVPEGTEIGSYQGGGSLWEFFFNNDDPVGYSVSLSPLAGMVPEPASWALMILGFAAIGATMRRKTMAGPRAAAL